MSTNAATARKVTIILWAALVLLATGGGAAAAAGTAHPSPFPSGNEARGAIDRAGRGGTASSPASLSAAMRAGRTIAVGQNPQNSVLDPKTHTLYVLNGQDGTVSVIDTSTCNAQVTFTCRRRSAVVKVGSLPVGGAVDIATDTIYVANANDNTVSVIDGAKCNAEHTSGCRRAPATVVVGDMPVTLDVNAVTNTVYVANFGNNGTGTTLSVIDGRTCNGRDTSGCGKTPARVRIGPGPSGVIVDQSTDTVYSATVAPDNSEVVQVINGATCNGTTTSGCGQTPVSVPVGAGSTDFNVGFAIDRSTKTLYVANWTDNTLSLIDAATCSAVNHSGCGQVPHVTAVGSGPTGVALDRSTHTVYVSNINDNTLSVLNAARCNATITLGCDVRPPRAVRTGRAPQWVTADPTNDTVYVPNGDDNTVSVLNGATCNAGRGSGCTRFPRTFASGAAPVGFLIDRPLRTIYLLNSGENDLSVLDASTCNVGVAVGCAHALATVAVGNGAQRGMALNPRTGTIYVPNFSDSTLSVIDTRTCNTTRQSGCGVTPATIAIAAPPVAVAVDEATDSVYVATLNGTVAVFDGTTCNAVRHSGCGQTPASVRVGRGLVNDVVVDQRTDTIYTADQGGGGVPIEHTISVIDGNTCNGTRHSGCGEHPPTVRVPAGPNGLAIDQRTRTLYDTTYGNPQDFVGFGPGAGNTVSMIDLATCNATRHSGCRRTPPRFRVGEGPVQAAIDQATGTVYVVNLGDFTVTRVDGASCNATRTSGCRRTRGTIPVGGFSIGLAVNPATQTVYVANAGDNTVSFFSTRRR